MFKIPAIPFTQFHHPPFNHTSSVDFHHPPTAFAPFIADSKSDPTAIKMFIATMMNGKGLNQSFLPMPQPYLIIMKPIHPAVAA